MPNHNASSFRTMQKTLNLPDDLAEILERISEKERRSFSSQCVVFLELAVSQNTTAQPADDTDTNPER